MGEEGFNSDVFPSIGELASKGCAMNYFGENSGRNALFEAVFSID